MDYNGGFLGGKGESDYKYDKICWRLKPHRDYPISYTIHKLCATEITWKVTVTLNVYTCFTSPYLHQVSVKKQGSQRQWSDPMWQVGKYV